MSTSNTVTKTDLKNILDEIMAIDGTDMTPQEVTDFVNSLNCTGYQYKHIVDCGEISFSTGSVASQGSSSATVAIPNYDATLSYLFFARTSGWLNISGITKSGSDVVVSVVNTGGTSHSTSGSIAYIAYK